MRIPGEERQGVENPHEEEPQALVLKKRDMIEGLKTAEFIRKVRDPGVQKKLKKRFKNAAEKHLDELVNLTIGGKNLLPKNGPMPASTMRNWKSGGAGPETEFLLNRIQEYKVFLTVDNTFIFPETGDSIRNNKIKCMLRRDYIDNYSGEGKRSGAALDRLLEKFLHSLHAAVIVNAQKGTKPVVTVEVSGKYMED